MIGAPNLASTVDRFATDYTRLRCGASVTDSLGYRGAPAPTSTTIRAHCYPTRGTATVRLPDGTEVPGDIDVSTTASLRVATATERGDLIVFDGQQYEIVSKRARASGPAGALTWADYSAQLVQRDTSDDDDGDADSDSDDDADGDADSDADGDEP